MEPAFIILDLDTYPLIYYPPGLEHVIYYRRTQGAPTMDRTRRTARRPRTEGPRILQRLFDPDADHPILRKLIQTIAPIAIAFLTTKLPMWLSGIDLDQILKPDHDEQE